MLDEYIVQQYPANTAIPVRKGVDILELVMDNSSKNKPMPKRAKADLNASENHADKPPRVPIMGPMLLSVKKKKPPVLGIAVASSALLNMAGKNRIPAKI